ncbi:isoprenoid synthase domain-containing protein [Mycena leptocephala]|nr:isoprenoid synthase domain-containing protein [Mycena leptocephala]
MKCPNFENTRKTSVRTPTAIILPNLLADWPFTASPNALQSVVADSATWAESYGAFSKTHKPRLIAANSGSSCLWRTQRTAGPGHFRAACDLMNLFFVFDKKSDVASGEEVAKQAVDIMEALRDEGRARSIAEYLEVRRGTIGIRPSFDFILLTEDLSDEVVEHPHIQKLALAAIDLNILVNQSREDDVHNMATVAMREMKLGFQEAVDHVGAQFRGIARAFCEDMKAMPEFPHPLDRLAAEYVAGMGLSVYTNVKWSFA